MRPVGRAALAELLPGRRLPDLSRSSTATRHVLRVPVAPHHAIVYGAALHRAVQEFHRAAGPRRGHEPRPSSRPPSSAAWSSEGFLTREHEEARLAAGRAALRRFRDEQLRPGSVVPAYVERDFAFTLDGDRIRGRWDRVDIEPVEVGGPTRPPAGSPPRTAGRAGRRRRRADAAAPAARAGHDHRLQVERRPRPGQGAPAGARVAPADDLRDGLRGDDRAAAGRGPAPLPRDRDRRPGRRSTSERLAKGREKIAPRGRRDPGRAPSSRRRT